MIGDIYHANPIIDKWRIHLRSPDQVILDPATGEALTSVSEASLEQINRAVAAATAAFDSWSDTTPADRSGMLLKLADRIEDNAAELARLESLNCGKPYPLALEDELPAVADCFRFFAGAARCLGGSAANEYLAGFTSMIRSVLWPRSHRGTTP